MRYDALVSEQNSNLLNYIASTVETMRDQIATIRDQMATKADLAELREEMATKAELAVVKDEIAAIRAQMATRKDLASLEARLELRIDTKTTAIRGDVEQVQLRLDSIDRALTGRIGLVETEVSRLRSVVYLLVKNKPEMLRLLGQSGLHENRPPS
jgi:hypothetical protein